MGRELARSSRSASRAASSMYTPRIFVGDVISVVCAGEGVNAQGEAPIMSVRGQGRRGSIRNFEYLNESMFF